MRPIEGRNPRSASSAYRRASIAWPRSGIAVLRQRQRLAGRDAQLPLDEVEARHHLGDRMLDLQARVHLHEVEAAVLLGDELDRARADVADGLRRRHRGVPHRPPPLRRHARGRRLLQHLLVPSLHRAVALVEVHDVAVRVREDLDLDVARGVEVALDQHALVAEARLRLALRGGERGGEARGVVHDPHALAAAARGGLDQHRIADPSPPRVRAASRPAPRRDSRAPAARRPCP